MYGDWQMTSSSAPNSLPPYHQRLPGNYPTMQSSANAYFMPQQPPPYFNINTNLDVMRSTPQISQQNGLIPTGSYPRVSTPVNRQQQKQIQAKKPDNSDVIYVFNTELANQAAFEFKSGRYKSIIDYHKSQTQRNRSESVGSPGLPPLAQQRQPRSVATVKPQPSPLSVPPRTPKTPGEPLSVKGPATPVDASILVTKGSTSLPSTPAAINPTSFGSMDRSNNMPLSVDSAPSESESHPLQQMERMTQETLSFEPPLPKVAKRSHSPSKDVPNSPKDPSCISRQFLQKPQLPPQTQSEDMTEEQLRHRQEKLAMLRQMQERFLPEMTHGGQPQTQVTQPQMRPQMIYQGQPPQMVRGPMGPGMMMTGPDGPYGPMVQNGPETDEDFRRKMDWQMLVQQHDMAKGHPRLEPIQSDLQISTSRRMIGANGGVFPVMFGPNGQPLIGPNGQPIMAPNGQPIMGLNGQPIMGPNGQPIMGPNGQPMIGPNGQPIMGPNGPQMIGPNGQPMMGPNGPQMMGPNGQTLPSGSRMMGPMGGVQSAKPTMMVPPSRTTRFPSCPPEFMQQAGPAPQQRMRAGAPNMQMYGSQELGSSDPNGYMPGSQWSGQDMGQFDVQYMTGGAMPPQDYGPPPAKRTLSEMEYMAMQQQQSGGVASPGMSTNAPRISSQTQVPPNSTYIHANLQINQLNIQNVGVSGPANMNMHQMTTAQMPGRRSAGPGPIPMPSAGRNMMPSNGPGTTDIQPRLQEPLTPLTNLDTKVPSRNLAYYPQQQQQQQVPTSASQRQDEYNYQAAMLAAQTLKTTGGNGNNVCLQQQTQFAASSVSASQQPGGNNFQQFEDFQQQLYSSTASNNL